VSARPLGPADYARACVDRFVRRRTGPPAPADPYYGTRAACFVSLKKQGALRGCIGTLEPAEADLAHEIARNAYSAAFHDPRFAPVGEEELDAVTCSVDVLSCSEPCQVADLEPRVYGVIVSAGGRRGVLLPDLTGVDDVATQLRIALQKAGIGRDERFFVERFTVTRFHEGDPAVGAPGTAGVGGAADE